jgi:L-threonylcarbamoyladenylate synthase
MRVMNPVADAARILRGGGLVAFATETVYGVGADATQPGAVRRIFAAKGRPSTNPLIAHVSDEVIARRFSALWPAGASQLAAKFWPGPLTLVVAKHPSICAEATAGRQTVGLRVPDHRLALELLREFGGAVAAPSANRSTHISPTTAEHVRQELGNSVDMILDGGPCDVGIESTVLDLSGRMPTILRPGAISREQIESQIGRVELFEGAAPVSTPAASPGQHSIHYAPRTRAYRFARDEAAKLREAGGLVAAIFRGDVPFALRQKRFHFLTVLPEDVQGYSRALYSAMRDADQSGANAIWIEMPPDEPGWTAVHDRLRRATTFA